MLLSNTCDNGIRAALYVATQKNRDFVPIREISEELSISFHFLTKILQKLTQAGLMTSFRGPNGGVTLARAAEKISLYDIIVAIDGPMLFTECVLGLTNCGDEAPCPLHNQWAEIRTQLTSMFQKNNLENMSEQVIREGFRLKDSI